MPPARVRGVEEEGPEDEIVVGVGLGQALRVAAQPEKWVKKVSAAIGMVVPGLEIVHYRSRMLTALPLIVYFFERLTLTMS